MKKILLFTICLLLTNNLFSQKEFNDYENPYFEFFNNDSLKKIDIKFYTKIDLKKLNFKEGYVNYYIEIPFFVNKKITSKNDFVFSMVDLPKLKEGFPNWSILKEDKTGIVNRFNYLRNNENEKIGIYQLNKDLTEPVKPGKYYIRLMVNEIPTEERIVHIYVGSISAN